MRSFDIPFQFQSKYISRVRKIRDNQNHSRQDFTPTLLEFGSLHIYLPRHFGFCFGVKNAIEKAYDILENNPNKNIYLIGEIIHNPHVNEDLKHRGLKMIQNSKGENLISWDEIQKEDIVIIPAFGTTTEVDEILRSKQIEPEKFDTTCPFVERVWNKGEELGKQGYSIIIHGDPNHEETKATLSRVSKFTNAIIINDLNDAEKLKDFIMQKGTDERDWNVFFKWKASEGFNFRKDLEKIAVVNQTTMLATHTKEISQYLKDVMSDKFGSSEIDLRFGSTRDTLCYATNDNQDSAYKLLESDLDLSIVVGGYNSSNTTHLVELLKQNHPVYFISSDEDLESELVINHYDFENKHTIKTSGYLPDKTQLNIGISSGASCPDALLERVLLKLLSFKNELAGVDMVIDQMEDRLNGI